ncbi:ATP-binding cassette domain-containing protein [Bariatricus massiliensis]|uniref:ATP-binding cassette domain-containing protein n=1 Tax=Bariatricus massiliensis TaxID=1745713 RepID=A0ABS8DG25_9FIRM|nr:oligopeptide/dipeptide ABC transporter ATP-binding protein [Bariatricus massiliensis]MCB7304255.1 ATP-binding cassette domain-containing protein [Bariatricus massiliensis]MCB7374906.1 ATP-binding cassette domain-containing protein [Bariatricus massiliensis]MCB7387365.1 ATP-binding cassette domain-containing protein [Bariatricus massiliensis]MCB7411527.1 ATP-binding cassette domain-containing protein [Bariatricus massiliensis]MCQ5253662.1 ATP-binding cassette domain-containing protein [Baria
MSEKLIEVVDLKKYFKTRQGDLHAVDGINFSINRGETLGIVGESGCGKSTLGRLVMRLHEATSGSVYYNGTDITKLKGSKLKELRKEMQIIFQDPYSSLNPRMTVSNLIAEPLNLNKVYKTKQETEARVKELMETVGLAPRLINAYPHELDGGRRQRIGIARALALNPKVIVCDEPVSALDVSIQAQILNLLMDLQDEYGLTYLFITHDLSVVKHISNRIAVMYLGQCIELASSKEIFANPIHPYTKALLSAIPVADTSVRGKKQEILKGEVVSPINPKPGCRFAPRCAYATEACTSCELSLREVEPGHFVSCRLFDGEK